MSTLAKHYQKKPAPKLRENPRIDANGHEVLDPTNHILSAAFRPPTLQEQISRLEKAGKIARGFLPDDDYDEDDFGDDFDDLPDEGITPFEVAALPKSERPQKKAVQKQKTPAATTPAPMDAEPSGDGSSGQ